MNDILLVNPPVNRLCDVAGNYFPLGIGYLAAILRNKGFHVHIYNAELETRKLPAATNRRRIDSHVLFKQALNNDNHPVWNEFRNILKELMPAVVGFSCTSASILPCLKMAGDAKAVSNSVVIFGGMHPTILPYETARSENVDYIVAGEAEDSFPALISALDEDRGIPAISGVGYVVDDSFSFIAPEDVKQDIDLFPFPDRNALVDFGRHKEYLGAVITSRGCPYHCTFCSGRNITGGKVRYRAPNSVIEEMRLLKEYYGQNQVTFYDDSLITNKKRILKLCEMMRREGLNLKWGGFTRVDSIEDDLIDVLKRSGCVFLGIGVESGSNRILQSISKGYTREQALHAVRLVRESGIYVTINIITGFPFEDEQDMKDTISLIRDLKVSTNVNTFTPYPKTELYEECVRRGLILGDLDWAAYSQHSPYNEFIQEMAPGTYRELLDEMIAVADGIMEKKK